MTQQRGGSYDPKARALRRTIGSRLPLLLQDRDTHSTMSSPPTLDKVNYGCGMKILPGWINADAFKSYYPWHLVAEEIKREIQDVELTQRHPFPDQVFRFGWAEDFLEHLDQPESIQFLAEAYRTLRPGGVLRLSFPGLAGVLARHYRSSNFEGAWTGYQEAYVTWHHKHFYSIDSLRLVATHLGFRACEEVRFGESIYPELRGLDSRPEQIDLNLFAELTR